MSSLKTLSKFTGLSESALKETWEQVKDNHKRLRECPGPHVWELSKDNPPKEYRCKRCGGTLRASEKSWYDQGFAHGRLERDKR